MFRRLREGFEQRRFPQRLGTEATKAELGKLKEDIQLAGSTTGKEAKTVVRSAVQAGERVGAAIPEDAGIDLSPPELEDPDESPDTMAPSLIFGPYPDDDTPEDEQITFGMDNSPADFDLFTDDDGGADPIRYF